MDSKVYFLLAAFVQLKWSHSHKAYKAFVSGVISDNVTLFLQDVSGSAFNKGDNRTKCVLSHPIHKATTSLPCNADLHIKE